METKHLKNLRRKCEYWDTSSAT